ncbi:ClpXP protease specificity-enhancing factor [Thiopseudomonas alkaliphila]|uniref:Peptidase n=1 Tax=Thiopseudomonas alkaliphila TaxID=1697053 RepID=A0A0K1XD06_9GAMM|nr:ClpXP protease specificity-enhancing factor [Thiopseudomonas alkaliphila]AKX59139.1 peptidase [Thiopseudomonas alkaliphila]MDM1716213.1 ClpXP protease specificity-enhancing factor [Thiopseudomonas alkaliphila]
MNSSRPYLIRALHEWLVDNQCTPHLLVISEYPGANLPEGFAQDGQIVLNVSPAAVRYLQMDNEAVSFEARFGGVPFQVYIPIAAVLAIYARENGQGMFFEPEELALPASDEAEPTLAVVDSAADDMPPETSEASAAKPAKGRPMLTVVK